ncbi:D-alanyl-D-alanine carboxypeptidase/D-alanyl-D-alanine endopeptidase [Flavihumibacter sp. UBA7668]|uniref:D-alanyl-D-alanine carboxypeptidase/D-alanyl-D-alanine endopeptidase n=1 Tax=Flavihumibacter sp. UBA7668 TaxID=1946542 RepID=UPI0025BE0053|nr:D-alanyl-D-alanine carboxypeptidase/D-alanyl-D-alanine-endopeptidase [Flavihumibacter sp. UBA7668]
MRWKQIIGLLGWMGLGFSVNAQSVPEQLEQQVLKLASDPAMKHAAISLSVLDATTGKPVYQYNEQMGLAPASTLKVMTSISSLAQLGPGFQFETELGYTGEIKNGILTGNLIIKGSGDPSLGSWRYSSTREDQVLESWVKWIKEKGIKTISGDLLIKEDGWNQERTPDGWIWQDIGNYYGAGAGVLNWRENQFDVLLAAGPGIGTPVKIIGTKPELADVELQSALLTGSKGSGDNAYIYLPPGSIKGIIRGTIPLGEDRFRISGALPDPGKQLAEQFKHKLTLGGISVKETAIPVVGERWNVLGKTFSPRLDSLVYWFMRKSINLYGEAMIKQLALKAGKEPSTAKGVDQLVDFWKDKGIEAGALQLMDGSGLSPQNRITSDALTRALFWSSQQSWFNQFFASLPVYNGMKLKSGSINGARAYAGFHTAANGKKYVVAILVNNYSGSGAAAVRKLYSVLDALK